MYLCNVHVISTSISSTLSLHSHYIHSNYVYNFVINMYLHMYNTIITEILSKEYLKTKCDFNFRVVIVSLKSLNHEILLLYIYYSTVIF